MKARPTWNPVNPFEGLSLDWALPPEQSTVQVFEDDSKGVLTENNSPDIPFRYSLNPYRGCTHACSYCYARRSHEYLGYGAGSDFETRIVVKTRAPELLRARLMKRSWVGERINLSGITDPYQPLEGRYKLVRQCLEICLEFQQPVTMFTRSPLIMRDLDLLIQLAEHNATRVFFSVPIVDPELCQLLEPGAPAPRHRFRAMRRLAEAGVPVGLSIAPVIPGLTDPDIPELLKRGRAAGASYAMIQLLRLPGSVQSVFEHQLQELLPLRAERILKGLREMRAGQTNTTTFGQRHLGSGVRWQLLHQLYKLWHKKLGYEAAPVLDNPSPFRRPGEAEQLSLF